ncbi:hypothetical protein SLA2020_371320 [Shorea laevis]
MSFPCFAFKITKCVATLILLYILRCFVPMFREGLARLGLLKRPEEAYNSDDFNAPGYVLLRYRGSLREVPVTVQELTGQIKKRLPVVEYAEFIKIRLLEKDGDYHHRLCSVCLSDIEEREEVRQLCNCCHAFHRECLDSWVDEGQVTCPVCRSLLFPAETEAEQIIYGYT